jgi:Kef-type K+ transport system membrane component KefB
MKKHEMPGLIAGILCAASAAYAHGTGPGHIDEGPSPGTVITIIMVVAWILIALGLVFFVRALIRRRTPNDREETNRK